MDATGAQVVVRTATTGVAGAVARAVHLIDAGTPVRLVVDRAPCSWETIGLLAGVGLLAQRTGAALEIELADDEVRALAAYAGLLDVLGG